MRVRWNLESEDTAEHHIQEVHDVWALAVCTSTALMVHEIGDDSLSA